MSRPLAMPALGILISLLVVSIAAAADSSQRVKIVHQINEIIRNEVGLLTNEYRAEGFTVEESTGKLVWHRQAKVGCASGEVADGFFASRISDLDANSVRSSRKYSYQGNQELGNFIIIDCKAGITGDKDKCFEYWSTPACLPVSMNDRFQYPDSVDSTDKSVKINRVDERGTTVGTFGSSFAFVVRNDSLAIDTTGDEAEVARVVRLLKQLIAGGQHTLTAEEETSSSSTKALLEEYRGTWRSTTITYDCTQTTEYGAGIEPDICSRTCSYYFGLTLRYDPDSILSSSLTKYVHLGESQCSRFRVYNQPEKDETHEYSSNVESVYADHITLRTMGMSVGLRMSEGRLDWVDAASQLPKKGNLETQPFVFSRID